MTGKITEFESPAKPNDKKGDELLKRMLKTPPKPHKPVNEPGPAKKPDLAK